MFLQNLTTSSLGEINSQSYWRKRFVKETQIKSVVRVPVKALPKRSHREARKRELERTGAPTVKKKKKKRKTHTICEITAPRRWRRRRRSAPNGKERKGASDLCRFARSKPRKDGSRNTRASVFSGARLRSPRAPDTFGLRSEEAAERSESRGSRGVRDWTQGAHTVCVSTGCADEGGRGQREALLRAALLPRNKQHGDALARSPVQESIRASGVSRRNSPVRIFRHLYRVPFSFLPFFFRFK